MRNILLMIILGLCMAGFVNADIITSQSSYFAFEGNSTNLWTPGYACVSSPGVVYDTSVDGTLALRGTNNSFFNCTPNIIGGVTVVTGSPGGVIINHTISFLFRVNQPDIPASLFMGAQTSGGYRNINMYWYNETYGIVYQKGLEGVIHSLRPDPIDTEWHHFVVTEDAVVGQKTYIDGVLTRSLAQTFRNHVFSSAFGLGVTLSAFGQVFNGYNITIDEYKSWSRALSDGGCSINTTCGGDIAELYLLYESDIEGQNVTDNGTTIILFTPENNDRDNQNLSVSFEAYDFTNSTVSCDLYIDGALSASNASVQNDTLTFFDSPAWNNGTNAWYVNCTDGGNINISDTYYFILDTEQPFITSLSPAEDNSTVSAGYSILIRGNVTDNSLFRVNRTIYYPNMTVFYNNYSGNLTENTTAYSWDDTYNTTLMPNGQYLLHIEASDSHTAKYFPPALFVAKDQAKRQLSFGFADNTINVSLVGGNVLGQFDNITTTKLMDRYTFELNFKNTITPNSRMVFRVSSLEQIFIIEGSQYPGHMVTGDYWLDFAGVPGTVTTTQVDEHTAEVEILTANGADKFVFQSIGGLNENSMEIEFQIDNCVPDWVCGGYSACNTSDLSACLNATDTNACGLPYTGDLSEFSPQACNYCSYDLNLLGEGACDAVTDLKELTYIDDNFATCCNITSLPADCYFGNESSGSVNVSCSVYGYTDADIAPSIIDVIVKAILIIGLFATPLAIFIIYNYARGKI